MRVLRSGAAHALKRGLGNRWADEAVMCVSMEAFVCRAICLVPG